LVILYLAAGTAKGETSHTDTPICSSAEMLFFYIKRYFLGRNTILARVIAYLIRTIEDQGQFLLLRMP